MDYYTVKFTCKNCGLDQQTELTWQPADPTKPHNPTQGKKDKALVTCKKCKHQQIKPVR